MFARWGKRQVMGRFDNSVAGWMLLTAMVGLSANVSAQAGCEPSCKPRHDQVPDKQAAVENGLVPALVFDDVPQPHWSINERMSRYRVPGVAIAVIADGKLAWSAGYGLRKAGEPGAVSSKTLFQATSLSKPVAAAAALVLVQEGRLSLDAGVNARLQAWKIPASDQGDSDAVTLRELLSHTSGLGLHGFPGYAVDVSLPSLVQILEGKVPANSPPVVLAQAPGAGYRYSGGGYQVMQLLLEQVTGQPFSQLADRRVLQPVRMQRSTFSATLPQRLADDFAIGHGFDGQAIAGGWHRYPELAAAGLWTTSTDLSRFVIAVMDAWNDKPQATLVPGVAPGVAPAISRQMLTPVVDGMGLGFGVHGDGDALYFDHSGANSGYQAYLVAYPARGEGLMVMPMAMATATWPPK